MIARLRFDRDQLLCPLFIANIQHPLNNMAWSHDKRPSAQVHFPNHAEAKFMVAHYTSLWAIYENHHPQIMETYHRKIPINFPKQLAFSR